MFPKTLSQDTAHALALLGESRQMDFAYLAGGTALALQIGHRVSIDLDFFSSDLFSTKLINENLKKLGDYREKKQLTDTMLGEFEKVQFSLFHYDYPLIATPLVYDNVNLASQQDIAAMKLVAITDRGSRKDYYDLYFLAKNFSFEEMFRFYDDKYHLWEANKLIILKSLQYFVEADEADQPHMIVDLEWDDVKNYFLKETKRLGEKYL